MSPEKARELAIEFRRLAAAAESVRDPAAAARAYARAERLESAARKRAATEFRPLPRRSLDA